ncbi:SRPBCC family protein [Streptomyces sp. NPDC102402]|uniref:SRPBCC family protein n=1 Tax=Streptomyces sp. NPDC102402 TaxID=3366169 RepID=UPI0037F61921
MVHVERQVTVQRPLAEVVRYLADFSHAVDWDPGTQECDRIDSGPLAEGAQWHNVSVFRGRRTELRYRLVTLTDDHVVFVGENRTATSRDDLGFRAEGESTVITYRATIRFHGLARLADPFLRREFERLGDEITVSMPEAIERHPA